MPTKKTSTSKKRSRVKVGKLKEPVKELSAKEQKKVKGGTKFPGKTDPVGLGA